MDAETLSTIILLGSFLLMVFLRFPIAYSVGISTVLCLLSMPGQKLSVLPMQMVRGVWSFSLMAVPFFTAPHWGEEMVLTLMVYMAVLSATLAIRKRSHIRMTAFDKYLPKKVLLVLDLLADIAVMALGVILLVEGLDVIKPTGNIAKFAKYSSLPNLSQIWMYIPVAVAGVSMIIFEIEQVFLRIEEFFKPKTEEKEAQA